MTERLVLADGDDAPVTLPDGTVLDGDVAEEYVHEVMAEVRRRNLVPGGKSLSGGGRHSPVVQTRVPAELRDRLQQRAKMEGVSVSKLARLALERYLAS